jgi:hypothetical protein
MSLKTNIVKIALLIRRVTRLGLEANRTKKRSQKENIRGLFEEF